MIKWLAALFLKIFGSTPKPDGEPVPAPGSALDAITIGEVTFHHTSPASFPVTCTLADMRVAKLSGVAAPRLSWAFTAPANWPEDINAVIGNMWIFAKTDGRWHAATWEWLRRTTMTKATESRNADPNAIPPRFTDDPPFIQCKVAPFTSWFPRSGDVVGHMVSSPCRGGASGIPGRSPIVLTVWP